MNSMKNSPRFASARASRPSAARRSATALLALLLSAGAAAAQQAPALGHAAIPQQPTLAQMTAEADLVFRGVAEQVQYVLSAPGGPEATRVPYTFVTYRINETLRGQAPGETITLRFIGGLDTRDDTFMAPTITPTIEAGDEDIMFVTGNTELLVPLVGDLAGRFRIVDNQVYSEMGYAVVPGNAGDIDVGAQYRLQEVETVSFQNGAVLRMEFDSNIRQLPSNAMTADTFQFLVRSAANQAGPAGPVVSADATIPVAAPSMTPAPPPAITPDQGAPAPDDADADADAADAQALPADAPQLPRGR